LSNAILWADWPAPPNILAGTTLRAGGEGDLPAAPQWLQQVHGNRVVELSSAEFKDGMPQADAVVAANAGDICVVRTADCLPVLLCSRNGEEIAAIHAGWRGLAAGVIDATVARMSSDAADLIAWLGPAIAQAAFEVGAEVREQFVAADFRCDEYFVANERGRLQADLFGLASDRLRGLGIGAVFGGGLCTFADPERFHSYRRDGHTGRLLSFVYRQESP